MAKSYSLPFFCLFFLVMVMRFANSARMLDELDVQPGAGPAATLPNAQMPGTVTGGPAAGDDDADPPVIPEAGAPTAPEEDVPVATPIPPPEEPPQANPDDQQDLTGQVPASAAAAAAAGAAPAGKEPHFSFYMHDIVGGMHPSARVVTGIVALSEANGIPFSKANNNFFPIQGGIPLLNSDLSGVVNSNNLPFLVGLNGAQIQNSGNDNVVESGDNQPFVSAGQLPSGASLEKLMFGTVTVVDDEMTEGHELGSVVIGKAQGFYLASSLDGTSQTMVLTLLLHSGEHHELEDTISLFGVHRKASPESQIAVIGGTGKYENARGYATLETLHQEDQHTTDGVDTIVHFSVYLSDRE